MTALVITGVAVSVLGAIYLWRRGNGQQFDLTKLIAAGESETVEFKSTLRRNLHTGKNDKAIENAVVKTVAAFLNTRGGTLIIGVSDDGSALGIENDRFENEDKMGLHLVDLVNKRLSTTAGMATHPDFSDHENARVLVVRCDESRSPIYMQDGNDMAMYVRTGAASVKLPVGEVPDYISRRFGRSPITRFLHRTIAHLTYHVRMGRCCAGITVQPLRGRRLAGVEQLRQCGDFGPIGA